MPPKDPKRSRVGKPPTIGAAPKSIWETYGLPPPPTPLPTLAPVTPGAIPPPPPTDDDRWAQGMIDTATDWRTKGSPVVRGVRTLLEKMPPIEPTPASMRAPTWLERLYDVVAPQGDTLLQQPAVQAYGALSNEVNQGFRGQLPEGVSIGALVDLPGKGPIKPKVKTRPGQLDLLGEVADDVVKDASGRVIAPKQTEIAPRPPGPWEKNVPATPAVTPEETRIAPKYKEPRYPPSTPPAAQPPVASPGSPTLKLSEVLSGEADETLAAYAEGQAPTPADKIRAALDPDARLMANLSAPGRALLGNKVKLTSGEIATVRGISPDTGMIRVTVDAIPGPASIRDVRVGEYEPVLKPELAAAVGTPPPGPPAPIKATVPTASPGASGVGQPPSATFSKDLQAELDYRIELMNESFVEEGETALTGDQAIYQAIRDMENSDEGWGKWKRQIQRWLVDKGVYREVSDAELARTTVMSAHGHTKKYDFSIGGKKYKFDKHLE